MLVSILVNTGQYLCLLNGGYVVGTLKGSNRRFQHLASAILVLFFLSNSSTIFAQGGDSQPPQINFGSINVTPSTVNAGETVAFSATVTDNMSGLYTAQVLYRSPSGSESIYFNHWYNEEGLLSVNFSKTTNVNAFAEDGVWKIQYIFLEDHAGNSRWLLRQDISNPSQYDFIVSNPTGGDSQPPQVNYSTINITPQTVGGSEMVTIAATVTDDMSGVSWVVFRYKSPSGSQIMDFHRDQYEVGLLTVPFSATRTVNAFAEDGVWTLEFIATGDHAGNHQYNYREEISNPALYDIVVNNPTGGDTQPPQVNFSTLSITPQTVSAGEMVTVSATVTDNMSGVYTVQAYYRSPSEHSVMIFPQFYEEEGLLNVNYSKTTNVNAFAEDGVWTLSYIFLEDHAGNHRWYNRDEISNPSQYDIVIINTFGPEEGNVIPENGSATVNFPNSDVTITIQTDETGTITVTRYPSSPNSPPGGLTPAGIYLNIEPSANLQGKPATFTVGYSTPLPNGVDEASLKIYRWTGSGWSVLPNQTLDTAAKTITVSVDSFSTFGVFGSASPSSDPSSSFKKIINRYLNIVNYSGSIEHEHTFSFSGGLAGMIATGKGDLGGVHTGTEVKSMQKRTLTSTEYYNLKTHTDALPGDYLKVVSGTSNHNNHSSQLGVEAMPGEIAVITEDISTGSDRDGSSFRYTGYLYSSEGRNRMEVGSYGASVSFDVEGTSEVYVSINNQDGSTNAGWWSIE